MTQDEIIEMAEQCGIDPHDMCEDPRIAINNLEAFAKLVAAKEQDRCCSIIYGQCGSDNVAERTVREIRKKGKL